MRVEQDPDDPRVTVHLVNNPRVQGPLPRHAASTSASPTCSTRSSPDVVHIGHLNHLSTSRDQRGRTCATSPSSTRCTTTGSCARADSSCRCSRRTRTNLWAACDGQERPQVRRAMLRELLSAARPTTRRGPRATGPDWVSRRMQHVREMAELVDVFIAPSSYLPRSLPRRIRPSDEQARLPRLRLRARAPRRAPAQHAGEPFTFGYIGTHIPAKGIHDLIRAFGQVRGDAAPAHLGPPARSGHRSAEGDWPNALPRRCRRARRVAARVPQPGYRRATSSTASTPSSCPRSGSRTRRW